MKATDITAVFMSMRRKDPSAIRAWMEEYLSFQEEMVHHSAVALERASDSESDNESYPELASEFGEHFDTRSWLLKAMSPPLSPMARIQRMARMSQVFVFLFVIHCNSL